ncbi:MAG: hypothetical protein AAB588_06910 [Patescibacteria group bacterium]
MKNPKKIFVIISALVLSIGVGAPLLYASTSISNNISTGNVVATGNLTVNGNTTLGDGAGDLITFTTSGAGAVALTGTGMSSALLTSTSSTSSGPYFANVFQHTVQSGSPGGESTQAAVDIVVTQQDNDAPAVGLAVSELDGTAGSGLEIGIIQLGTAWDYGLMTQDDVFFQLGATQKVYISNSTPSTLSSGGALDLNFSETGPASGVASMGAINVGFTAGGNTGDDADTFAGVKIRMTSSANDQTTDDNVYGIKIDDLQGTPRDADDTAIFISGGTPGSTPSWDDLIKMDTVQNDDSDATDTNRGIFVNNVQSRSTDADSLYGIEINNLSLAGSGDGTPIEQALRIGSGWDANIFFNDTTTQIQIADTGVFTFEDAGGNDLLTLTDGGTVGNMTVTGMALANGFRVTNGTPQTASAPNLTKANLQAASFWGVNTASNAVAINLASDASLDAADVGRHLTFAVTTGHSSNALTIAGTANMTVVNLSATTGTTSEDVGDYIDCLITATNKATCAMYAAD